MLIWFAQEVAELSLRNFLNIEAEYPDDWCHVLNLE
jgi:hypothetical protein